MKSFTVQTGGRDDFIDITAQVQDAAEAVHRLLIVPRVLQPLGHGDAERPGVLRVRLQQLAPDLRRRGGGDAGELLLPARRAGLGGVVVRGGPVPR